PQGARHRLPRGARARADGHLPESGVRLVARGRGEVHRGVSRSVFSSPRTLFEKIWSRHVVTEGAGGMSLLYIDRLLMHDGAVHTFDRLPKAGRALRRPAAPPRRPDPIAATADHYVPTATGPRGIADPAIRDMVTEMARHTADLRIPY